MHYTNYYYRPVHKKRMKRNFSSKPGNFWKWAAAAAVPAAIMAGKYLLTGDVAGPEDIVSAAAPAEGVTIPGPEINIDNGLRGGVPISQGKLTLEDLHTADGVSRMPPIGPHAPASLPGKFRLPVNDVGSVGVTIPGPEITINNGLRGGVPISPGKLTFADLHPAEGVSRMSPDKIKFSRRYPRVSSENFASAAGAPVIPMTAVAAGSDPQTAPYVAMPMQPNDYQRYPLLTKFGHMAGGMLKGGALGFVPAAAALGAGSVLNNDALFNTGVGIAVGAPIVGGVGGYLYGKALADYDPYEYLQRKR